MARSMSEAAAPEPATPFAALLDSTAPAPEPRNPRPDSSDRGQTASPAGNSKTNTSKPAQDSSSNPNDQTANADDNPVAAATTQANDTGNATTGETAQADDTQDTPQSAVDDGNNAVATLPQPDTAATTLPPVAVAARSFAAEVVAAAHTGAPPAEQIAEVIANNHSNTANSAPGAAVAADQPDLVNESQIANQAEQAPSGQLRHLAIATTEPQTQTAESLADGASSPEAQALQATAEPADNQTPSAQAAKAKGGAPQDIAVGVLNTTDTEPDSTVQDIQVQAPQSNGANAAGGNTDSKPAVASPGSANDNGKPNVEDDGSLGRATTTASRSTAENVQTQPQDKHSDIPGAVKTGVEALQNQNLPTPVSQIGVTAQTASVAAGALAHTAPSPAVYVPMTALAVEITSQAQAGNHRFEIRLDPPELGRIDVRLDIDREGRVSSRLVVDRSETLDLLRRDAPQLERALQQAGLKMSDNALEFGLRQQAFSQNDTSTSSAGQPAVAEEAPVPGEAIRQSYRRLMGMGGGLDIHV
jgi:flagellar hook-length control protein FliK